MLTPLPDNVARRLATTLGVTTDEAQEYAADAAATAHASIAAGLASMGTTVTAPPAPEPTLEEPTNDDNPAD